MAAKRQAAAQQPSNSHQQPSALISDATGALVAVDAPGALVAPVVQQSQQLAPYVPLALDVVGRILSGKMRAAVAVRANVALRVLEMHREDRGAGLDAGPEVSVLERLEQALSLRRRTVDAATVEPIPSGEAVTPDGGGHS